LGEDGVVAALTRATDKHYLWWHSEEQQLHPLEKVEQVEGWGCPPLPGKVQLYQIRGCASASATTVTFTYYLHNSETYFTYFNLFIIQQFNILNTNEYNF